VAIFGQTQGGKIVLVAHLRRVVFLALALTALLAQSHHAGAQGAEIIHESLDFSGCFPDHQFQVCVEISGKRHQIAAPNGRVITGFTETSCFTITSFGEFISQRCQTEHSASMTVDGFLTRVHDSGSMEFTDGVQTCAGHFLLQIANGELVVNETNIECI
jgi:hypothetical protein